MLSVHDEALLDWFFGPAQSLLERSTMGGMLDRAALYGGITLPVDPELALARHEHKEQPWTEPPGALTARPRGTPTPATGHFPEEGLLSRYARASRLVRAVAERDLAAASVLGLYYGDQGARWGRSRFGRLFVLYAHTESGERLLKAHRGRKKGADLGLSHAEELSVVWDVERVQPQPARRLLMERTRREALALLEHAQTVWIVVREGGGDERPSGRASGHDSHHG